MRTTLNIDDSLLRNAAKLTGVEEKTSLVRMGLEALIAKESARRLANLGGTEKRLRGIRRRRPRRFAWFSLTPRSGSSISEWEVIV
jgi:Arc/MetJ family transcription regulator